MQNLSGIASAARRVVQWMRMADEMLALIQIGQDTTAGAGPFPKKMANSKRIVKIVKVGTQVAGGDWRASSFANPNKFCAVYANWLRVGSEVPSIPAIAPKSCAAAFPSRLIICRGS
jgi:hypothetical protein